MRTEEEIKECLRVTREHSYYLFNRPIMSDNIRSIYLKEIGMILALNWVLEDENSDLLKEGKE